MAATGDSPVGETFDAFVAEHRRGLFKFVRGRVARDEDAEDISQETLLRTWRRRSKLVDPVHRRNFAYRVAANLVIDHRRVQDSHVVMVDALPEDFLGTVPGADTLAEQAHDSRELVDRLDALPPAQRDLIVDSDILELSADELEERHQATGAALRSRRYRAREALRREFERTGAPAIVLPVWRKIQVAWRATPQRISDGVAWASAYSQPLTALVTSMTVVVGPFGPFGALSTARALTDYSSDAMSDSRQFVDLAFPADPSVPDGQTAQPSLSPAPTPSPTSTRPMHGPSVNVPDRVPDTCVPGACVGSGKEDEDDEVQPGDRLWVKPLGEEGPHITEGVTPVCEHVPDNPGVGCEREREPEHWQVEPPPAGPSPLP